MGRKVIFIVDVEPDEFRPKPGEWGTTDHHLPNFQRLRREWSEATAAPVHFHWFLRFDPHIRETFGRMDAVVSHCPKLLEWATAQGDAFGLHPHLLRWDAVHSRWYNEYRDRNFVQDCIFAGLQAFQEAMGCHPKVVRLGDRFYANFLPPILRKMGFELDLSQEPGQPAEATWNDPNCTDLLPDTRQLSRDPYQQDGLWHCPLTASPPLWTFHRHFPFVRRGCHNMNLVLQPRVVARTLQQELACASHRPLTMVLRSGDLGRPAARKAVDFVHSQLLRSGSLAGAQFVNALEALRFWQTHLS